MGEYARRKRDGQEIKIGTCEDMYYLRADQRHLVSRLPGSLDPSDPETQRVIRFRFPWPHEDGTQPGEFEDYSKAVAVYGIAAPASVEHYSVQFSAPAGYLVSLPCPEGPSDHRLTIHRNGFKGAVQLVQQKLLADGRLVPVCQCGGCGAAWRVEDPTEIEAIAVAFRSEADSRERQGQHNGTGKADRAWWDKVADRILEGAGIASQPA